jgi:hypothetical protein
MTCRPGGVWQVERLDARQPAIARSGVRIVCWDGWQMERLGLVLRIGGRRWALLFLLHGADVYEPARRRPVEALPHVSVLRCPSPVMRVAALSMSASIFAEPVAVDIAPNAASASAARCGIALRCCVIGVGGA